ncbi:DUF3102 domain-containing protein [Clostridium septicum]|uniref:DUF3102 domain-containing protein n=2 Tax=Clostridium septicum TaxID=1504 RepID=A0ABY5B3F0_CLOSE|nr:DUF3102 domain-containing protein [Clostridium septicum]UEC19651.1 DUF3102 domain-containing protein [Clostridium septicum]USS02288.1 DUF3102 domain-containing protein [Clostridium septicum]
MIEKAIKKINEEMDNNSDPLVKLIGNHLLKQIDINKVAVEKILKEKECIKNFTKYVESNYKDIGIQDYIELATDYFGIDAVQENVINISSNGELSVKRTPGLIAAEINDIKFKTKKMVLYNSIEIGRKLVEAKELLPHGEWGNWLEKEVEYSKSTANNLMKIFKEYGAEQTTLLGDNTKIQAFGSLSYSQAVLLLGIPLERREDFIKDNNVENLSTRELEKIIRELKQEKEEIIKEKKRALEKVNDLEETNKAFEVAFNSGAEERNRLETKIEKLEEEINQLVNKQIDATAGSTDSKLQEEVYRLKKEKEEKEVQLQNLQNELYTGNLNLKIYFDQAESIFKTLLKELEKVHVSKDEFERYSSLMESYGESILNKLENNYV